MALVQKCDKDLDKNLHFKPMLPLNLQHTPPSERGLENRVTGPAFCPPEMVRPAVEEDIESYHLCELINRLTWSSFNLIESVSSIYSIADSKHHQDHCWIRSQQPGNLKTLQYRTSFNSFSTNLGIAARFDHPSVQQNVA